MRYLFIVLFIFMSEGYSQIIRGRQPGTAYSDAYTKLQVRNLIADSISSVSDTSALKLKQMAVGRNAYLQKLSSTNTNGSDWFVVVDSSDYAKAPNGGSVFDHPTSDRVWVRLEYKQNKYLRPEWFGAVPNSLADTTTNQIAFEKMFAALPTGFANVGTAKIINLGANVWYVEEGNFQYEDCGLLVYGESSNGQSATNNNSMIVSMSNTYPIFDFGKDTTAQSWRMFPGVRLKDFSVSSYHLDGIGGIRIRQQWNVHIENVTFRDFRKGYGLFLSADSNSSIIGLIENAKIINCQIGIESRGQATYYNVRDGRIAYLNPAAGTFGSGADTLCIGIRVSDDWTVENVEFDGLSMNEGSWACDVIGDDVILSGNKFDGVQANGYRFGYNCDEVIKGILVESQSGMAIDTMYFISDSAREVLITDPVSGSSTTDFVNESYYPSSIHFDAINITGSDPSANRGVRSFGDEIESSLDGDYQIHYRTFIDSSLAISNGAINDFQIFNKGATNDADHRFFIDYLDVTGSGASGDTIQMGTMSITTDDVYGSHKLHTRAEEFVWIAGEGHIVNDAGNFYGTGGEEHLMKYTEYGGLYLGLDADDGSISDSLGSERNFIMMKNSGGLEAADTVGGITEGFIWVNTSGEWVVMDNGGNQTTISPHNSGVLPDSEVKVDKSEWFYNSINDSVQITVNMFKVIQDLESITGKQYIWKKDLKTGEYIK